MKYRFFTVPVHDSAEEQLALNQFCAQHRIATLEKEFVANADNSFWSFCISYLEGADSAVKPRKGKVDYKEVLSERDFTVYVKLRDLRKTKADQEGVPAYALFTNEQLATMVQQRATTLSALGEIEGIGQSRLEKYGQYFIDLLKESLEGEQRVSGMKQYETTPN